MLRRLPVLGLAVFLLSGVAAAQAPTPAKQWNNFVSSGATWTGTNNWLPTGVPTYGTDLVLGFGSSTFQPTAAYTTTNDNATAVSLNALVFNSLTAANATSINLTTNAAGGGFVFNTSSTSVLPSIWQQGTGRVVLTDGTATTDFQLNNGTTLQFRGDGLGEIQVLGLIGQTGAGNSSVEINQAGTRAFNTGSYVRLGNTNNSFAGGVALRSGNLVLTAAGGFGAGGLTVNTTGGAATSLQFDPAGTTTLALAGASGAINLQTDLTVSGITSTASPVATFGGVISGPGGMRFVTNASASFAFTAAHTFQGAVLVAAQGNAVTTLTLGSTGAAAGSAVNASGFTVTANSSLLLENQGGALGGGRVGAAAPLTLNRGNLTFNGNSASNTTETFGTLTVNGGGAITVLGTAVAGGSPTQTLTFGSLNRGEFGGAGTLLVTAGNLGGTGGGTSQVRFTTAPTGAVGGADSGVTRPILPYVLANSAASTIATAANVQFGFVRYDATRGLVPLDTATEYAASLSVPTAAAAATNQRYSTPSGGPAGFGQAGLNGPAAANSLTLDTNTAAAVQFGASLGGTGTLSVTSGAVLSSFSGTTGTLPAMAGMINLGGLNFGAAPGYFHAAANLTVTTPVSGSGGVVKNGGQQLNLNSVNSFTGGLTINLGPVHFNTDANLGAAGQPININSGLTTALVFNPQVQFTGVGGVGTADINRPVNVGAGGGLVSVQLTNNVLTFSGALSGTGQLGKTGAGVLSLTGTSPGFSGQVLAIAGTLAANSDAALGTGPLNLSGGVFQPTASYAMSRPVYVGAGTTIFTNGNNLTLNGVLAGQPTAPILVKEGAGDLVLTAANTFAGSFNIGGSAVAVRGTALAAASTAGRLVLRGADGGLPMISGTSALVGGELVLDNTDAANSNRVGSVAVAVGGGSVSLLGNAATSVSEQVGTLSYLASTSAPFGGTLTITNPGGAGVQTNLYAHATSTAASSLGTLTVRGASLGAGGTAGPQNGAASLLFNTTTAATPALLPAAGGILPGIVGSQATTGDATTFLTLASVTLAAPNATGAALNNVVPFAGYTTPAASTALGAGGSTLTYDIAQPGITFAGTSAANALRVQGGQTLDLGGGTLTLTAGHVLTTGLGTNAINNGTLAFGSTIARLTVGTGADLSIGAVVTGSGSAGLVKSGGGVLTLNAVSTLTGTNAPGAIAVGAGTLRYGVANALPVASVVLVNSGAELDLGNTASTLAGVSSFGNVRIGSGSLTLDSATAPTVAFGGSFIGTGGLVKNNTNTVTVAGDSSGFSGTVTINGGVLQTNSNTGLGTGPILLGATSGSNAANLALGTTVTAFNNPITVRAGALSGPHAVLGNIAVQTLGSNIDIQQNAFTVATGGFTAGLAVSGIGFQLAGGSGTNAGIVTQTGVISSAVSNGGIWLTSGNWAFNGDNTFNGFLADTASTTTGIGIGRDSTPTSGTVTSGPLGRGTLFFPAARGGNLRADGAARTLGNPISLDPTGAYFGVVGQFPLTLNGAINLNAGTVTQVFTIANAATTTLNGVISNGTGGVTKVGPGVLVLGGANTYTGATVVNAGTLRLAATGTVPGATTVNSGAVLAGTGTIAGAVTVTAGGTVSPGASPGILTAAGATFTAGVLRIEVSSLLAGAAAPDSGTSGTPGTTHGQLASSGGAAVALSTGTVVLVDLTGVSLTPGNPYSLQIVAGTGTNSVTGTTATFVSGGSDISSLIAGYTINPGGSGIFLNFTPVPEPTTVLAVAGLGLAAVRLRRRVVG